MHELSVCNALIRQVERISHDHGASGVHRIFVVIGPLSGIEPELLRRALPLAAAHTVAHAAELVIRAADVVVRCNECAAESVVSANRLLCGVCGDFRTRLVSGDEMILERVELNRAPHSCSGAEAGADLPVSPTC